MDNTKKSFIKYMIIFLLAVSALSFISTYAKSQTIDHAINKIIKTYPYKNFSHFSYVQYNNNAEIIAHERNTDMIIDYYSFMHIPFIKGRYVFEAFVFKTMQDIVTYPRDMFGKGTMTFVQGEKLFLRTSSGEVIAYQDISVSEFYNKKRPD